MFASPEYFLLLILLIIALQAVLYFVDFSSQEVEVDAQEVLAFRHQIDSLKEIEIEKEQND